MEEGEALNIPDDSGNTQAAPDISVLGASAADLTVQNEVRLLSLIQLNDCREDAFG